MAGLFITASGTGIGKSFVTAALCHQLRDAGRPVRALKPVVSGLEEAPLEESDPGVLLRAMGREVTPGAVAAISPWQFKAPLSPDMAARMEGRELDMREIARWCKAQAGEGTTLVEGVGGCMVPLNHQHTVLDWMRELDWPVIVVGGSYLGSMSHTLTACHAVRVAGLAIKAVVLSETRPDAPVSTVCLQETALSLSYFIPEPIITVAYMTGDDAWMRAPNLLGEWL